MENFEFKSQICTTRSQSETLLKLGLKKETADCMYSVMTKHYNGRHILEEDRQYNLILFRQEEVQSVGFSHYELIPAWSLHRLMLIANDNNIAFLNIENMYETLIKMIASNIKWGLINKDYLEEKK